MKRFLSKAVEKPPFTKVLIANRGEIACRVMKTCRRMGIKTVAVYSDADSNSLHVRMADEAINIGPPPTAKSYLDIGKVVDAVKKSGAQAVHPGYGFLSENSKFVHALSDIGAVFIGPSEKSMAVMGDKITSKQLAKDSGVNTIPGFAGAVRDLNHAIELANKIGYPIMLKAAHGGGGKGMRIAWSDEDVRRNYKVAKSEAMASFGDDTFLIEKFIDNPRHIEIQLIGDQHGNTYYLPERECSIQRRNQKVIEEAPSVHIDQATREAMGKQAVQLAKRVGYFSAGTFMFHLFSSLHVGTVEFLVDSQRNFYFLEMNTRLQVEHPITEYITGLDLVEQMLRVAAGEKLVFDQDKLNKPNGWAIESRVYAEDPRKYLPSIGRLTRYIEPKGGHEVRCDSGIVEGSEISMYYDPMICKLCTYGKTRDEALGYMETALDNYVIKGVTHNIPLLREVIDHPRFRKGALSTKFLPEEFPDGFQGHVLSAEEEFKLLAVSGLLHAERDIRNRTWLDRRDVPIPNTWDLMINLKNHSTQPDSGNPQEIPLNPVQIQLTDTGFEARVGDRDSVSVNADWLLETPLVKAHVGTAPITVQYLDALPLGFRLSYLGSKYDTSVFTSSQASALKFMKPKKHIDLNKLVLSPMPGVVVSLSVKDGDVIAEGEEVAVVEAMKMQNVLRASKAGKVLKVHVKQGSSVQANDILIELAD
jgi:propionyl-CoA carboxylase alpha chain